MTNVEKSYDNLLPNDEVLYRREDKWLNVFIKYSDIKHEDEFQELLCFEKEIEEQIISESEGETISEEDYEDNILNKEDNFDLPVVAEGALAVIKKRVNNWHRQGIHFKMDSYPCNVKVENWLMDNSFFGNNNSLMDNLSVHSEIRTKEHKIRLHDNINDERTVEKKTKITTMTIKEYSYLSHSQSSSSLIIKKNTPMPKIYSHTNRNGVLSPLYVKSPSYKHRSIEFNPLMELGTSEDDTLIENSRNLLNSISKQYQSHRKLKKINQINANIFELDKIANIKGKRFVPHLRNNADILEHLPHKYHYHTKRLRDNIKFRQQKIRDSNTSLESNSPRIISPKSHNSRSKIKRIIAERRGIYELSSTEDETIVMTPAKYSRSKSNIVSNNKKNVNKTNDIKSLRNITDVNLIFGQQMKHMHKDGDKTSNSYITKNKDKMENFQNKYDGKISVNSKVGKSVTDNTRLRLNPVFENIEEENVENKSDSKVCINNMDKNHNANVKKVSENLEISDKSDVKVSADNINKKENHIKKNTKAIPLSEKEEKLYDKNKCDIKISASNIIKEQYVEQVEKNMTVKPKNKEDIHMKVMPEIHENNMKKQKIPNKYKCKVCLVKISGNIEKNTNQRVTRLTENRDKCNIENKTDAQIAINHMNKKDDFVKDIQERSVKNKYDKSSESNIDIIVKPVSKQEEKNENDKKKYAVKIPINSNGKESNRIVDNDKMNNICLISDEKQNLNHKHKNNFSVNNIIKESNPIFEDGKAKKTYNSHVTSKTNSNTKCTTVSKNKENKRNIDSKSISIQNNNKHVESTVVNNHTYTSDTSKPKVITNASSNTKNKSVPPEEIFIAYSGTNNDISAKIVPINGTKSQTSVLRKIIASNESVTSQNTDICASKIDKSNETTDVQEVKKSLILHKMDNKTEITQSNLEQSAKHKYKRIKTTRKIHNSKSENTSLLPSDCKTKSTTDNINSTAVKSNNLVMTHNQQFTKNIQATISALKTDQPSKTVSNSKKKSSKSSSVGRTFTSTSLSKANSMSPPIECIKIYSPTKENNFLKINDSKLVVITHNDVEAVIGSDKMRQIYSSEKMKDLTFKSNYTLLYQPPIKMDTPDSDEDWSEMWKSQKGRLVFKK